MSKTITLKIGGRNEWARSDAAIERHLAQLPDGAERIAARRAWLATLAGSRVEALDEYLARELSGNSE